MDGRSMLLVGMLDGYHKHTWVPTRHTFIHIENHDKGGAEHESMMEALPKIAASRFIFLFL
jgi:hypothetical protein